MRSIYKITDLPNLRKSVVTLGIFDGVHLGHQKIISQVVSKAKNIKAKSVVVTFWPHPEAVIHKKTTLHLSSLRHRIKLIEKLNPDFCIIMKFDRRLSAIPMEEFVQNILINKLKMKYIYIGEDFKFGNKRTGSAKDLIRLGRILSFKACIVRAVRINGRKISSSRIRVMIQNLRFKEAEAYLGRRVSLAGEVTHGEKRGRLLGFPTANVRPQHEVIPPDGVYAVKLIFAKREFYAICYIGAAPTFSADKNKKVEVHIFNFDNIIYNKTIEVQFIKFLRKDRKFSSKEALIQQIEKDILAAKKSFSKDSTR